MQSFTKIALVAATAVAACGLTYTATADHHAKTEDQQMNGQDALSKLLEGNKRYVAGEARTGDKTPEERAKLAEGQSPYAVIVSCADSRVPPELAFDAGPGDLFVIRVAGNVVDDFELASIEYAVAVLESPLVMVLGHQSCGAVDAAVKSQTEDANYPGHIHDLVEAIRPAVQAAQEGSDDGDLLEASIAKNAQMVVDSLKDSKPIVGQAVEDGKLTIVPARYSLETGEVTLIGEDHPAHEGHDSHEGHDHD